jgi:hypothetical protein
MKKYFCVVTGEEIPPERVDFLLSEGLSEGEFTSINGARLVTKKLKGVMDNNVGLFICKSVALLHNADNDDEEDGEDEVVRPAEDIKAIVEENKRG